MWVKLVQFPADHGGHDGLLLQLLAAETRHHRPVPHHRGAVGQRIDLRQLVGDEDGGDATVAQVADNPEEDFRLLVGQTGGGFVENQHGRLLGQSPGDHHQLPLARVVGGYQPGRIKGDAGFLQDPGGAGAELRRRDPGRATVPVTDQDVFGHGEVFKDADFLGHIADTLRPRIVRGMEPDRFSL